MAKKRISKPIPPIPSTEAEACELIRTILASQLANEKLVAARDEKIQEASAPFDEDIAKHEETIEEGFATLQRWATANRDLFGERKSRLMAGQRLGWRTNPHKTATANKLKWDQVVEALQGVKRAAERANASEDAKARAVWAEMFLRQTVEPAKELMLAKRDDKVAAELLAEVGVIFVAEETFYLDTEREGQASPNLTA